MKNIYHIFCIFFILLFISCNVNKSDDRKKAINELEGKNLNSIDDEIISYIKLADLEYSKDFDSELAYSYYFDSIPNLIIGTYVNDFAFTQPDGSVIELNKISKPIFIQVSTLSNVIGMTNASALSRIYSKYKNDVEFLYLLCNLSNRDYDINKLHPRGINVSIQSNDTCGVVNFERFNHFMGFPYNFYIDKNLKIINCGVADGDGKVTISDKEIYEKIDSILTKLVN